MISSFCIILSIAILSDCKNTNFWQYPKILPIICRIKFHHPIHLYYQMGYSANKIESILPIGHATAGKQFIMMIIQRCSLRTKNKTCSKEYPLREYSQKAVGIPTAFFVIIAPTISKYSLLLPPDSGSSTED